MDYERDDARKKLSPSPSSSTSGSSTRLDLDFSKSNGDSVGDRRSKLRLSFGKSPALPQPETSIKTSISLPLQIQSLEEIGFSTQVDRLLSRSLQTTGRLHLSPDKVYPFTSDDLEDLGEIGRGCYGSVNRMMHRSSGTIMAVKRIVSTVDEREQKELIELAVVMGTTDCINIIQFYGAIFKDGDCWICMELMDTSLESFYRFVYDVMKSELPEEFLGKVAVATLNALNYLKSSLNLIHRDVKPSNILLDRRGNIKLCDFGISGKLVDSIARTNVGCRPYMAPERIDPTRAQQYDIRADVWSFGITMTELATGSFPYPIETWDNVFQQLSQVVDGEPPQLSAAKNPRFSKVFVDFVNSCLKKDVFDRPKYKDLLKHPFVKLSDETCSDTQAYVQTILHRMDLIDEMIDAPLSP